MGNETGERATTEDKQDFAETIASRRNRQADQRELRPFIDRLVHYDVLPEPEGGEYELLWVPITELSEQEWADLMSTKATAIDLLSAGTPDRMYSMEELRTVMNHPPERGSLTGDDVEDSPPPEERDPAEEIDESTTSGYGDMASGQDAIADGGSGE